MILGVCGSPRKKATEYVLRKSLKILQRSGFQTEFFTVKGKKIAPCKHCDYCLTHQKCCINDDMNALYELLKESRGIIMATPVYNGGVSAQLKSVLDRTRALCAANRNVFKHKVGMVIAVGGDRAGGQELAIQQILTFYILNGIIPVSGGPFGANIGASFWSKDTLEGVRQDKEGFKALNKTVKEFTNALQLVKPDSASATKKRRY
jgi:multimeric flavodoxin WrbA